MEWRRWRIGDISRSAPDPFGINLGLIEFEANTEHGRFDAWANLGRAPLDKYGGRRTLYGRP